MADEERRNAEPWLWAVGDLGRAERRFFPVVQLGVIHRRAGDGVRPGSFVRDNGAPQWLVRPFQLPRRAPDCTLTVDNGDSPATRVTSGAILLNGRLVVRPAELKKAVPQIRKSVRLWKRNRLVVSLAGKPGVFLTVTLRCVAGNTRPVADAGPNRTVRVGDTVTLDGGGSSDADGDVLSYTWSLREPRGSGAALSDPTAVQPTFTVDQPGRYIARLVVNDGQIDSKPDSVVITTENSPPVSAAGLDQTVAVGDTVTLDGGGSSDVDGDTLTYRWSLAAPAGSRAVLSDPRAVKPRFTADQPGAYTARLVVNDGRADSEPDEVVVSTENSPPVADAGPDLSDRVGETVTLDGSGSSDADGDPLTFEWALLEVPPGSGATLSDSSVVRPTLVLDRPGVYVAQLLVSDDVDESSDTVTVTTENSPPVADAGPDQRGRVGTTVTLDGSGSSDVDGDALSYTWSLTDRPAGSAAALSDPHAVQPHFDLDLPGHYVAQLLVSDGAAESSDTLEVTTVNSPPVADAGPAQTVALGATVTLDGGDSSDVDGDPLTYAWALINIPDDSNAVLSDPTAVQPSFVADLAGDYVVQLIVSDGTEDSASDSVVVTTANSRPVADAGPDQMVAIDDNTVNLDGSGSIDVDGDPLTYAWAFIKTPDDSTAVLSDPTVVRPSFKADLAGDYVVQLIVSDGTLDSEPDAALVTVTDPTPANHAPTITSTAVEQATPGQLYRYQVTATDQDAGDVLTYALATQPDGMTIDAASGLIEWTPTPAQAGDHGVQVRVMDNGGLAATQDYVITVAEAPPANAAPQVDAGADQSITLPINSVALNGTVTDDGLPDDPPPAAVTVTWTQDSGPGTATFSDANAEDPTATFSAAGTYVLRLTADDGDRSAFDAVTITVNAEQQIPLPPDPATVAPPLDRTVPTTTYAATEFLYSGSNPIQTGVAPGTIEPQRAALVRGKVLADDDSPLPGVQITIHGHPELGGTLSRADGMFDLVVNGGGVLVVQYTRTGYLPAQRHLDVPWQDYAWLPDVVLKQRDAQVTPVSFGASAPLQVARGSLMSDSDGARQATLLFPAGTQAQVLLPDGSTQPAGTLNIRATEYTVGPNGPQAMPAELPPTSGYTYAVELNADEANGRDVRFSQPVVFYLENFLDLPVGIIVPVGYYDADQAGWVPSDDGWIIQILSIDNGMAVLDLDGQGTPADAARLAEFGITDAERAQLAALYTPGQSLWRAQMSHFSDWDLNLGGGPPPRLPILRLAVLRRLLLIPSLNLRLVAARSSNVRIKCWVNGLPSLEPHLRSTIAATGCLEMRRRAL